MKSLLIFCLMSFYVSGLHAAPAEYSPQHLPIIYTPSNQECTFPFFTIWNFTKPLVDLSVCQQTTSDMSFIGVNEDGTQLMTEIRLTGPVFPIILQSGRDTWRLRNTWKLVSCDSTNFNYSDPKELEQVIASMRVYDFHKYMSCTFQDGEKWTKSEQEKQEFGAIVSNNGQFTMTILDIGDIAFHYYSRLSLQFPEVYYKWNQKVDEGAEVTITNAAKNFARILRNYGNLLLALREAPAGERTAALNAFLNQNKAALLSDLSDVEKNLSSSGPLTKISATATINQGYFYVRNMEAKINQGYIFDQVIPRVNP